MARGYNSYRGRRSKGKMALAALLILLILAAVVVILLQRHIIYDETGTPRMEMPWGKEEPEEASPEKELDLVIHAPAKTVAEICGFQLAAGPLTRERYETAMEAMNPAYNAVAVVLKDETGTVYFDTDAAVSGSGNVSEDTSAVLAALTGSGEFRTIACISGFHDPKAANADVEGMGLKNTGGYIFYDGNNSQWLDPAKPAARAYLCQLAADAAERGFQEILLTGLSYPTEGKLDKIAYGETERSENLKLFLKELRNALEPYGTVLTVQVSPETITTGEDAASGQKLAEIAALADRLCAPVTMEEAEALSEALRTAGETVEFLPLIEEYHPAMPGNCLVVEEN